MFRIGRQNRFRIHPLELANPRTASLITRFAVATRTAGRARIGVTDSILYRAERITLGGALPEVGALVLPRFAATRDAFEHAFLLDDTGHWDEHDRPQFPGVGNSEVVAAALDHRDRWIITPNPLNLPNDVIGPLGVRGITVGDVLRIAADQIPVLLAEVLRRHREKWLMTQGLYIDYLRSNGLHGIESLV